RTHIGEARPTMRRMGILLAYLGGFATFAAFAAELQEKKEKTPKVTLHFVELGEEVGAHHAPRAMTRGGAVMTLDGYSIPKDNLANLYSRKKPHEILAFDINDEKTVSELLASSRRF